MKLSMDNHNFPYLVIALCLILGSGMVYFTHGDMVKGVRRIRKWCHI